MKKFNKFSNLVVQNIGIIIIILSVIAFFQPVYFKWMTKYTVVFLAVAMFGMGTSINSEDFKNIFIHPKEIIIGCIAQYTVMPFAAWILVTAFDLPIDLALGVILVASCPGGTASNVITHIAGGDISMSVAMTITSTLLAPIVTPTLVYALAGKWVEVSFIAMFKSVLTVILVPVLLGIFSNKLFGKTIKKAKNVFPFLSALAVALIISGIIAANSEKIVESGIIVLAIVIVHNAIGFISGLAIGKVFKMEYDKTTALSVEIALQNSGLAVSLAAVNFAANPLATLPGAVFSIWQNIAGSIFANIRKKQICFGKKTYQEVYQKF